MSVLPSPCVVQYLFVHEPGQRFSYPSSRADGDARRLADRYLECVLVQAASLRLAVPDCETVLVTNLQGDRLLDDYGRRLLEAIERLGVRRVHAPYAHAPADDVTLFYSSRYVLDAIDAVAAGAPPDQQLWMVDVDCVWVDPAAAFAARAGRPGIGCVTIPYPPDWDVSGWTRNQIAALGGRLGTSQPLPHWVGGELLTGSVADLRALVAACDQLDHELVAIDVPLPTEEQLLTLAGGIGRVVYDDCSHVAGRIWTGRRHGAINPEDPAALALWHLPGEKGLAFRRAARPLLAGRSDVLARDLATREQALQRFNLAEASTASRLRDDAWIAVNRLRERLAARR